MKRLHLVLVLIIILSFSSCSNETKFSELVNRNDIFYKVNSQSPFSGKVVDYYDLDQERKKSEGNLVNGKFDGKWTNYYPNTQVKNIFNYSNGKKDGKEYNYQENGISISEKEYLNGIAHGTWTTFFNNGSKEKITNFKNGNKDGTYTEYFNNNYSNKGEIEGFKEQGNFKMNSKSGEWRYKDEIGALIKIETYENNTLNGYFENRYWSTPARMLLGDEKSKKLYKRYGNYKYGVKDGTWTLLENNVIKRELTYENGKDISFEGEWKSMDTSTGKSYYEKYENGKYYWKKDKNSDYTYSTNYEARGGRISINRRLFNIYKITKNNYELDNSPKGVFKGARIKK